MSDPIRRLAVIGGGISGLAAAVEISGRAAASGSQVELLLLEQGTRLGGEVRTDDFEGTRVDLGAESLLARDPGTVETLSGLGLGDQIVRPQATSASIWNGRALVPIPAGSALGVPPRPLRPDVLRAVGVLGALRASLEPALGRPRPDPDSALGPFLSRRLGSAVFRELVDPLLGGVYAGPAADLSIGAVAPQLLQALDMDRSLLRGLRRLQTPRGGAGPAPASPFLSLRGGLESLVAALAARLPPGSVQPQSRARQLLAAADGRGQLRLGSGAPVEVDGVVIALPAPQAAELLSTLSPAMSSELRRQEYSSVAIVTLAYPDAAFARPLTGSGFLVRRQPRRVVTACTYLDRKWPHLRQPGLTLLRVSAGSLGEEWVLGLDDATLVSSVHRALRRILGVSRLPVAARVQRWQPALPQYRSGHLAWRTSLRVQALALPVPTVLAGAAYSGVGLAACLREGASAGQQLWDAARRGPRAQSSPGSDA